MGLGVAVFVTMGCGQVLGLDEMPCEPGCTASGERIYCDANGEARTSTCDALNGVPTRCSVGDCIPLRLSALNCATCATRVDGSVWCWGADPLPVAASSSERTFDTTPRKVPLPEAVRDVSVGQSHACAVTDSGDVYCWGDNSAGQAKAGASAGLFKKVVKPTLNSLNGAKVKTVAAGNLHTCALTTEGDVYCWGANYHGQCGTKPSPELPVEPDANWQCFDAEKVALMDSFRVPPVKVELGNRTAERLFVQKNTSCVLTKEDAQLLCWGSNCGAGTGLYGSALGSSCKIGGQLGIDPKQHCYSAVPMKVDGTGKLGITGMELGHVSGFVISAPNSDLLAWGNNGGQLGRGPSDDEFGELAPVRLDENTPLVQVAEVVRTNGWMGFARMNTLSPDTGGTRYVSWGKNDCGELGQGAPTSTSQWIEYAKPAVNVPNTAHSLVSGQDHVCFMDDGDDVFCLGAGVSLGRGGDSMSCGDEGDCGNDFSDKPVLVKLPQ
jgi:alpha-tubulin suppressor-like RCC1 family protein